MHTLYTRINTGLLVFIALTGIVLVTMMATRAYGGSLDPPSPPAGTMHTLDDTAPVWDQKLDSTNGSQIEVIAPIGCNSDRFKCVFPRSIRFQNINYDGVLDRETGLVWQRTPPAGAAQYGWDDANILCSRATTGGRMGWRLPTEAELTSLLDATTFELAAGNPFVGVTSVPFWSSTEDFGFSPTQAWIYTLGNYQGGGPEPKSNVFHYWCVRGATSNH